MLVNRGAEVGLTPVPGPTGDGPRLAVLDRDDPLPLWAQLYRDLVQRLELGDFDGGFPGELALAVDYAVSRQTVREATRRLRADGLVLAGRGRPSTVAPRDIEQPLGALYSLFAAVEAAGMTQRSIVRRLETTTSQEAAGHLQLPVDTELLYLERLRLADGIPLAWDRVWLPAGVAGELRSVDFTHTALYTELDRRCGIRLSGGREQLRAVIPTGVQRRLLKLDPAVAAFAIDRVGYVDDKPLEFRRTLVRGDRFTVSAEFSGRGGYQLSIGDTPPPDLPTPRR